jgi:hypothetical protein
LPEEPPSTARNVESWGTTFRAAAVLLTSLSLRFDAIYVNYGHVQFSSADDARSVDTADSTVWILNFYGAVVDDPSTVDVRWGWPFHTVTHSGDAWPADTPRLVEPLGSTTTAYYLMASGGPPPHHPVGHVRNRT